MQNPHDSILIDDEAASLIGKRGSFLFHPDNIEKWQRRLTTEQIGQMVIALSSFSKTLSMPEPFSDTAQQIYFEAAADQLKIETLHYADKIKKNRENGAKGGRVKASNRKQMLANANEGLNTDTDMIRPDNDSKNRESLSRLMNRCMKENSSDAKKQQATARACLRARFGAAALFSEQSPKPWEKRNMALLVRAAQMGLLDFFTGDQVNDVIQYIYRNGADEETGRTESTEAEDKVECSIAFENRLYSDVEDDKDRWPDEYKIYPSDYHYAESDDDPEKAAEDETEADESSGHSWKPGEF